MDTPQIMASSKTERNETDQPYRKARTGWSDNDQWKQYDPELDQISEVAPEIISLPCAGIKLRPNQR